jgi:phage baseplate assembly protein W
MDRAKLFGNDLQLAERAGGMDLITNQIGDLALAQGNDNIAQALLLRLRVRLGELAPLGWASYGSRLHELIGEPNNARTHVRAMAFAREAIQRDPRVIKVSDIRATVLPGERDVVHLMIEVLLINEPNPLNLVFDQNLAA